MWPGTDIFIGRKTRIGAAFFSIAVIFAAVFFIRPGRIFAPAPLIVPAPKPDPWKEAANGIEEDRGEPVGREAAVGVPQELRHYSDRRRFLAVQAAKTEEQHLTLPHDYAGLIHLIRGGELVEMEPLGDDYILYGAGESATDEPFTHFDRSTGEDLPLLESREEYETEYLRLVESLRQQQQSIADLQAGMRRAGRDRALKKALAAQIEEARAALEKLGRKAETLAAFYRDSLRLNNLFDERKAIYEFANHFADKSYNLDDSFQRRQFKIRLLSFVRPQARSVILETARAYKEQFGRHLPITSLVRSEQYQRKLGETNPNAARNAAPPHTTGLAFDVYYRFMTAAEQNWLMSFVARLKSAGRVEALRETRDHIHIFAFPDSRPPGENMIRKILSAR